MACRQEVDMLNVGYLQPWTLGLVLLVGMLMTNTTFTPSHFDRVPEDLNLLLGQLSEMSRMEMVFNGCLMDLQGSI